MRLDLSSQIVLDKVPQKYYKPESEFDVSVLCHYEKIPAYISKSSAETSLLIARQIASKIREKQIKNEEFVFTLPGDHSAQSIYQELVGIQRKEGTSLKNVLIFNIYEFYFLHRNTLSNLIVLRKALLNHVDIDPKNVYSPNGFISKDKVLNHCRKYELAIGKVGGIDFILLYLGHSGNIEVNIPGASISSKNHLVLLDHQSKKEAINIFGSLNRVPSGATTMGLSAIMSVREITLIA
jgi:glucosamine-6-phosphate deaminase